MYAAFLAVAISYAVAEEHVPALAEKSSEGELEKLLKNWEVQSQRGRVIQIEFERFVCDPIFRTEQQSTGRMILGQNQYRVDIYAIKYNEGQKSQRKGYKLSKDRTETWIGNSERTTQINHDSKAIDIWDWMKRKPQRATPKQETSSWFPQIHIPVFLEMHVPSFIRVRADHLNRQFDVSLEQHNHGHSVITMLPRGEPELQQFKSIVVMWSHEKRRVHAVRMIDPTGTLETVYVVKEYLIDPPLDLQQIMNPQYPNYSVKEHPSN